MKVEYRSSFLKDIKRIKSKSTTSLIQSVIENCENAGTIAEINNCEALQSRGKFFKIKCGQYCFGIFIDKGTVEFLKFGTRQNFYDDFPPF